MTAEDKEVHDEELENCMLKKESENLHEEVVNRVHCRFATTIEKRPGGDEGRPDSFIPKVKPRGKRKRRRNERNYKAGRYPLDFDKHDQNEGYCSGLDDGIGNERNLSINRPRKEETIYSGNRFNSDQCENVLDMTGTSDIDSVNEVTLGRQQLRYTVVRCVKEYLCLTEDYSTRSKCTILAEQRCSYCKKLGHRYQECHKQLGACYSCGVIGHRAQDCMNPQSACYVCGQFGHVKKYCKFSRLNVNVVQPRRAR